MSECRIDVVGIVGEIFGSSALRAIGEAGVLVGSSRQLATVDRHGWASAGAERIELTGPLAAVLDSIADSAGAGRRVCVLASGDPGFFGIVRALRTRFDAGQLAVHPAPSSVALAFARLGLPWDDAEVVSAHGRPLEAAAALAIGSKVAVLTSPASPPQAVGAAFRALGCGPRAVAVASQLGEPGETVVVTDLAGLAAGEFDPLSVVVLTPPESAAGAAPLSWGLPEPTFEHRGGMITKSEVRAVALGKLELPPTGVLWDLGAGSASVAIECARLRPGLKVFAVERDSIDAGRAEANAVAHGVDLEVVRGEAPGILAELPDPDRVFVGGGGLAVLDAAAARLRAGGVVVASYTLLDRAAAAAERLGNLVQISVARGIATGEVGTRLRAENPVFLCWGPRREEPEPERD